MSRRPISVNEAAELLGITPNAILKKIHTGKILAKKLSNKGFMVSRESTLGKEVSEAQFEKECSRYISVPEACDIVCVTDGMIGRMLKDGRLNGFRLNDKAWAVERKSAEENYKEAISRRSNLRGHPRKFGEARRPKKKPTGRARSKKS